MTGATGAATTSRAELPEPAERYVPSRLTALRTNPLAIEHAHALRVGALPLHHRDPFDRLLIAQALVERVPILAADSVFERLRRPRDRRMRTTADAISRRMS